MDLLSHQDSSLSKLDEIIKRAFPIRDGVIICWDKKFARMFKDEMLNPVVEFDQAKSIIRNYLNRGGAEHQYENVEQFILEN